MATNFIKSASPTNPMTDSVVAMLQRRGEELDWFGKNFNTLCERFENQFVAILNNKVVAAQPVLSKLFKEIEAGGMDRSEPMVKFVTRVNQIL